VAIKIQTERLLTFAKAARYIPRRRLGKPVAPSTLWRWHRRGVLVSGRRVFLEAVRTPSGAATSLGALQRFIDELSGGVRQDQVAMRPVRDISEAVRALDQDNI